MASRDIRVLDAADTIDRAISLIEEAGDSGQRYAVIKDLRGLRKDITGWDGVESHKVERARVGA